MRNPLPSGLQGRSRSRAPRTWAGLAHPDSAQPLRNHLAAEERVEVAHLLQLHAEEGHDALAGDEPLQLLAQPSVAEAVVGGAGDTEGRRPDGVEEVVVRAVGPKASPSRTAPARRRERCGRRSSGPAGSRRRRRSRRAAGQRVRKACALLKSTDESPARIASLCGLGSEANLRHHVSRFVGVPPVGYRRAFRSQSVARRGMMLGMKSPRRPTPR